jgi:ribonuclease P protein component
MSLRFCPDAKRQDYRLAVVVSKKISKSAVARNRIRRRIYEVIRIQMAPDQPFDMVVTVFQASVQTVANEDLQQEIADILRQADLKTHGIIETIEN